MRTSTLLFLLFVSIAPVFANNWINIATPQRINSIEQIDEKYYIGTNGGLIIYDPVLNSQEHQFKSDGLPSIVIEDITQDADGTIWIGTYDNGVARFVNGEWEPVDNPFSSSGNALLTYCIEFDNNGTLWTGTSNGIFKYENELWSLETWQPCWDMQLSQDGRIWAASHMLLVIENGTVAEDTSCPVFAYGGSCITIDTTNQLFFSAPGFGIASLNGTQWHVWDQSNSIIPIEAAADLHTSKDGTVWALAPNKAMYAFNGNFWQQEFSVVDFPELNYLVTDIYDAPDNGLWIGTSNSLTTYNSSSFQSLDLSYENLSSNFVQMATASDGEIVVKNEDRWMNFNLETFHSNLRALPPGYNSINLLDLIEIPSLDKLGLFDRQTGILWIDNISHSVYDPGTIPFAPSAIRSFLMASDGQYWIATLDGLFFTDGSSWQYFTEVNSPFTDASFWVIGEDRTGQVWASTPDGIGVWNGSSWSQYFSADDHNHMFAAAGFDFYFDDSNHVWFGGWGTGLVHYDGISWEAYTTTNSDIPGHIVYDIENDGSNLYVATLDGVGKMESDGSFTNFTIENSGIQSNSISKLQFDKNNNLWISHSGQGISVYNKDGFPSGIELSNLNLDLSIHLYPNPAQSTIQIQLPASLESQSGVLNISDLSGKQIVKMDVAKHQDLVIPVDISRLEAGLYIVSFQYNDRVISKKFVVR